MRPGTRAIVIHTMSGTLAGTDGWFANPASAVSAHFGVGLGGEVHQYVETAMTAWANGILEPGNRWTPTFGNLGNPNSWTVSIETEDRGDPAQPVTDAQYAAVLAVCRELVARFRPTHLLRHADISPSSRARCPGTRWTDSGRFHALALALGLSTAI